MKADYKNHLRLGRMAVLATICTVFLSWGLASGADFHQPGLDCTECHDMSGATSNAGLIAPYVPWDPACNPLDPIVPPCTTAVVFDGLGDYADGDGFGICEVCHTTTAYYRSFASGRPGAYGHTTDDCSGCHDHCGEFLHGTPGTYDECWECHGYSAGYEYDTDLFSAGEGTAESHSTHTQMDGNNAKGPSESCTANCHLVGSVPHFAD